MKITMHVQWGFFILIGMNIFFILKISFPGNFFAHLEKFPQLYLPCSVLLSFVSLVKVFQKERVKKSQYSFVQVLPGNASGPFQQDTS
jgi:hypothetical protein